MERDRVSLENRGDRSRSDGMSHNLSGKDQLLRSSDAGLVHDLAPAPNLGIDEPLQLLWWRTADGNRAEINHLLLDFWQFQNALQHGMKLVHHRIRGIRRCDNHRPGDCIETGDPCLRDRWDFGRGSWGRSYSIIDASLGCQA